MKKLLIIIAALALTACTAPAPIKVTPDSGPISAPGLPMCKTVRITVSGGNTLYTPITTGAVVRLSQGGKALGITGEAGLALPTSGLRVAGVGYDVAEQIGAGLVRCK